MLNVTIVSSPDQRNDSRLFMLITIVSVFAVLYGKPAIGQEFRFCTPNIENQRIFKVSHAVLNEAFRRLGHDFILLTRPAKRCPVIVNSGKLDGDSHRIFSFNSNNQFPNLIRVDASIQTIDQSVFTKNSGITSADWQTIKQYKILYLFGIKIIELGLSDANVPEDNIIPVFSHEEAFRQLDRGRGDLIIVNSSTGKSFINDLNLTDSGIRMLEPPLIQFDLYPYMHKKHRAIAEKLARTLNEMKNEGFYAFPK